MNKLFLALFSLSLMSHCFADVPLLSDGKPMAKIYVSPLPVVDPQKPQPETSLQDAVRELNYHLQKMSGASLEVVQIEDAAQVKGPAIVLGSLPVKLGATPQKKSESLEGYRLLTR